MNQDVKDKMFVEMHGDIKAIKQWMADPCPVGVRNTTSIKWLYILFLGACGCFAWAINRVAP